MFAPGRDAASGTEQLHLFCALPGDLVPRDAQDLMAYPFFSLAKSESIVWLMPVDFRAGAITIPRRVRARARNGDHLGRRRSDLGGLADRQCARRKPADYPALISGDPLRNPCNPVGQGASARGTINASRPASTGFSRQPSPHPSA